LAERQIPPYSTQIPSHFGSQLIGVGLRVNVATE